VIAIASSAESLRFVAAALAAFAALVLIGRRIQPLVASIVSLLALSGCLLALGNAPTLAFFSLLATFAIVAAINSTRDAVIAWFVGAVLIAAGVWFASPADQLGDYALTLGLCTVMWVAGLLVSRRTRQAALIAMKLEVTELERAKAVQDERSRIARELHDVVSHGLTVVIVQTVAARTAIDDIGSQTSSAPIAEVDRHMEAVETAAREALGDMRRMLGLLQSDQADTEALMPAAPRLLELPALFDRARAAGLDVDDSRVDTRLALSHGLELTVYRIIQEGLTNAIKHAPGSHVVVTLRREGGDVCIGVADAGSASAHRSPIAAASGGRGLLGMRERAAAYGGSLVAERPASGGFTVQGRLPIDQGVA
jgi:signal transduction histidine kinase